MKTFAQAARPLFADFLSTLVFVVLMALKVDVRLAIMGGVAAGAGQVAWRLYRRQPVALMQWMSLGLVLASGAASFLTHDPRFVMAKPSVIYLIVAGGMMQRGWMLRYVPPVAQGRADDLFVAFGYVWAGLMAVTAVANAVVAIAFTPQWTAFIAVVPLVSKIGLFLIQYAFIRLTIRRRMRAAAVEPAALAAAEA
ncbi:septation protein IspZ [Phenylobacterium sp.]|uniref:septation protein IspZ n=1 Tax=Phenylobacterium sp. TaxID=1871053 RepID=UPI0035B1A819